MRLEAGDFDSLLLNGLAAATGFAALLGLSGLVGDGIRIGRALLQPVREKAFPVSEGLVVQSKTLSNMYLHHVQDPALLAINARAEVWKGIKAFREAKQV